MHTVHTYVQVKGIESRLKITEDRLFQERSDRADKLSEIEDKLLNENARLHVRYTHY